MPFAAKDIFFVMFPIVWILIFIFSIISYRRNVNSQANDVMKKKLKTYNPDQENWELNNQLGKPENGFEPWSIPKKDI